MRPTPRFPWPEELARLLQHMAIKQGRWRLFFMVYRHDSDRAATVEAFEAAWPGSRRLMASPRHERWVELEDDLAGLSADAQAIQVMGLERWLDVAGDETSRRLGEMNMRRDQFAARVACPVLFWLTPEALRLLTRDAKDLWSWRTRLFRFLEEEAPDIPSLHPRKDLGRFLHRDLDLRSEDFKRRRLGEWCLQLHRLPHRAPVGTLCWGQHLIGDMVRDATSLGDWQEAEALLTLEFMPRAEAAGDLLGLAEALGLLADLRAAQARRHEAVRHRRDQVCMLRRLNARNARELALSSLAGDLLALGDIRQARRLWERGFMRTYLARGNRQWQAFTKADLIRCLLASDCPAPGDLLHAERVLREQVLPQLPDLAGQRATALTLDLLADVIERRGEWDDALRIRRREVLPLLESFQDVRLVAWVVSKIADSYAAQGRFDDAVALRIEAIIPVFRHLGDKPALAVMEADQAIDRAARDQTNAVLAAMRATPVRGAMVNPDRT